MNIIHLAETSVTTESLLMVGMGAVCTVVGILWRKTEKENARQVVRADNCESENKRCQAQHAEAREKQAVLANDVAHLREQLTYFRELSLRTMGPSPAMPFPPPSGSAIPTTPTQPIA